MSMVEDGAFREFVRFLEPQYKVPCRKTVTDRLESVKAEPTKVVKDEMATSSAVSVTTDIWSSLSNEPYISFTASYITEDWQLVSRSLANKPKEIRHTQANIGTKLKTMADSWCIVNKINTVVHDGAANMQETGSANQWTDVSCSNHKLRLAVTGDMCIDEVCSNNIVKCVGAASRLVTHFSHNPLAELAMEQRQMSMGIKGDDGKPLKLIKHVKTLERWNPVYDTFERLVKLRWQ